MSKRFEVVETFRDFQLVDNIIGRSAGMGDGVGINFGDDTTDLECGMVGFAEAWEAEINSHGGGDYFEAYFPDLYSLVIYDNPGYIDRYTAILDVASGGFHNALGLSDHPDSPLGFSQMGVVDAHHLAEAGERIAFLDLPQNVQRHIARRLEDE